MLGEPRDQEPGLLSRGRLPRLGFQLVVLGRRHVRHDEGERRPLLQVEVGREVLHHGGQGAGHSGAVGGEVPIRVGQVGEAVSDRLQHALELVMLRDQLVEVHPAFPDPSRQGREEQRVLDAAAWGAWLAANHQLHQGVWLKIAKKNAGVASVTNDEAVDVGLCWGWISGHRKALDETYFLQRYTPRRPHSNWSAVNVAKVEALIATGRMQPPGLAEVNAAKADGRWDRAYGS